MIKNRISYLMLLGAAIAASLVYTSPVLYILLYGVILLPVITFLLAFISQTRFAVKISLSEYQTQKEQTVTLYVDVTNRSFFPYMAVIVRFDRRNFMVKKLRPVAFPVMPKSSVVTEYEIFCPYRGQYRIKPSRIEVYDLLGIFVFRQKVKDELILAVYPRVIDLYDYPLAPASMQEAKTTVESRDEDYSTISDIRTYEQGDNIKKIHWKLTARKNELMVKDFQATAASAAILLLNTSIPKTDEMERIILEDMMTEQLCSVANHCLRMQNAAEVTYGNIEPRSMQQRTSAGFPELYAFCAGIEFEDDIFKLGDFSKLIDYAVGLQTDATNIIAFTGHLDDAIGHSLVLARLAGHNVILNYFSKSQPTPFQQSIIGGLTEMDVSCIVKVY